MSVAKEKERLGSQRIRVLLVEDNEADAKWAKHTLERFEGGQFDIQWAERLEKALELLKSERFDVVISDLKLPDSAGLATHERLNKAASHIPIILLTGTFEEEKMAIQAIQKGAQDYLFKGQISPQALIRSLVYAMERHKFLSMRDNFINVVSHELRSPLSSLREAVALVHDGTMGSVSARQKEFFKIMLNAVDRMERTTSELLELAKMGTGKSALHLEDFNMVALAEEMKEQFEAEARKKSVIFNLDVPNNSSVMICADRDKIVRVLINLLGNALKFTETGTIKITAKNAGDAVECSVSDTGKGIAPEDLPKVFSKFEQFGKKGRGENQGSGLGLSICQEIINLHHGTIWVESELGKGSRFAFCIPKKTI